MSPTSPSSFFPALKGKNLKWRPSFGKALSYREANKKSRKLFHFAKVASWEQNLLGCGSYLGI